MVDDRRPLRLEYLDAASLDENPANWRLHPSEQTQALSASIDEVGWAGALLYNERTKRLLDGHARRKLFAGKGEVPVLVGSWDEATERKILAVLDPLGGMTETNRGALADLLRDVGSDDAALSRLLDDIVDAPSIAMVAIADLKEHPRNYRSHTAEQIDHLARSIAGHGFYRNVVIARDNTILAGHGVVRAAVRIGKARLPAVRLDVDPDDPRALKIMASDNEIARLAEVDDRALTELLKDVMESDVDGLLGTGFDHRRLAALAFVTRPESELEDFDAAAEWVGMPAYESGAPPPRVVVSFETPAAREEFMRRLGATVINKKTRTVWSIWWPEKRKDDLSALRFDFDPLPEDDR